MRMHEKQWSSTVNKDIFGADFHQFIQLEEHLNHMEIAEELGISLAEVKQLKKKRTRA